MLYPHFQKSIMPGWLDKALRHRHRATEQLDNVVVLSPDPEWVQTLPNGKLPDRADFKAYGDDVDGRIRRGRARRAESARLGDEFAQATRRASIEALPLV